MQNGQLHWISNFIWGIADDILRDLYVRGKYRDVILPMVVIRRLDAVLEPNKQAVLEQKARYDEMGITSQDIPLRQASGHAFYNVSPFTLRELSHRNNRNQLRDDFCAYLDGFSDNVQEIIDCFDFRNQIPKLSGSDNLGHLIAKFLDPSINLSPYPTETQPGLDNHAMGTIFEDLVRRFNEANNEEAGQHWTPRDVVQLMAKIVFLPVKDQLHGTYLIYDGACGTGGMLTLADEVVHQLAKENRKTISTHLYGQEINAETYAIAKADLLLKGEGRNADNLRGGHQYSTLSNDAFSDKEFDFMLSNPPYGKSWKTDYDKLGGKRNFNDPRFVCKLDGELVAMPPRSSDGQLLFLLNLVSKMKYTTEMGSRIAEVHNGSSLFTGDAGSGESNIRRYIIENDWLDAIIALPTNIFYNTGIATYVWIVCNKKPAERKGKVQLIDASEWNVPLRKNMGQKNCELSQEDIEKICDTYLTMTESEYSKIFHNHEFGYYKFNVERPLRLAAQFSDERVQAIRFGNRDTDVTRYLFKHFGDDLFYSFKELQPEVKEILERWGESEDERELGHSPLTPASVKRLLSEKTWRECDELFAITRKLRKTFGEETIFRDLNQLDEEIDAELTLIGEKLSKSQKKSLYDAIAWTDPEAAPIIKKKYSPKKVEPNPLHGLYPITLNHKEFVVEYESDTDLRESEQVPLSMYSKVAPPP